MGVLARLAIHRSLTHVLSSFSFAHLSSGFFTIPYNTLQYLTIPHDTSQGRERVRYALSSCFLVADPGLKTLRRPNARSKTKIKKLRSGLDITHNPTGIDTGISTVCKL